MQEKFFSFHDNSKAVVMETEEFFLQLVRVFPLLTYDKVYVTNYGLVRSTYRGTDTLARSISFNATISPHQ